MECDNRFYLYTGHKFLCTISSTSVTIKKSPLSNFRIVSEQGRTKDLKTQNWQLYKSPERASAVSTNIWGDQPSRRSGSGFIVFGSEAWVPVTSLGACDQFVCLSWYASSTSSACPRPSPTPSAYTPVSLRYTLHKLAQPCHSCRQTKLGSMSNFPGLCPYVSGHHLFVFFSFA